MKIAFYPTKYGALIDRLAQAFPEVTMARADRLETLAASLDGADALVTANSVYSPEMGRIVRDHGKSLRWIQFTTSGFDSAIKNGLPNTLPITNGSGMHARRVAEHAIALALAVMRRFNDCAAARPRRAWIRYDIQGLLTSLERKTLVLVGLGAIGQDIARKAKAFDMRVIAVSRSPGPYRNVDEVRPRERLVSAFAEADVAILATSYDSGSHRMVDAAAIAALKPTAVFVNIARGTLVDEAALIAALKSGSIYGAGLDVMEVEPLPADNPLWDMPNVVLSPHSAGAGGDNTEALFDIIGANMKRFIAGQPFERIVHGPCATG